MWMGILTMLVLVVPVATAQDRLDAVAAALDRATATPQTEAADVDRMAKFLGTTPDVLRAERASTKLGWGDLFISHRIATRGGHPIDKVFAARRSGAPWGTIAEEAGVQPDLLVADVATAWPDAAKGGAVGSHGWLGATQSAAGAGGRAPQEPRRPRPRVSALRRLAHRGPHARRDSRSHDPRRWDPAVVRAPTCGRAISYNEPMFSNPSWPVKEPACSSPSRRSSSGSGTRATSPTAASPPSCSWPRAWAARSSSRDPRASARPSSPRRSPTITSRPLIRLQCYEGLDEGKALYEWKYAKQLLYTQLLRERIGELIADAPSLPEAVAQHRRPGRRVLLATASCHRARCCRRSAPTIRWCCWWTRSTRPSRSSRPSCSRCCRTSRSRCPSSGPSRPSTSRSWC